MADPGTLKWLPAHLLQSTLITSILIDKIFLHYKFLKFDIAWGGNTQHSTVDRKILIYFNVQIKRQNFPETNVVDLLSIKTFLGDDYYLLLLCSLLRNV
mgnify:CR=1 FL=1